MCVDESVIIEYYNLLREINPKLHKTRNRPGVSGIFKKVKYGDCKYETNVGFLMETEQYGLVVNRFNSGKVQPAKYNTVKSDCYELLKNLIEYIDPDFIYNTITLNHNSICKAHYDKLNKSPSLIIGLGEYTGGELIVENCLFDIKNKPLIFNGGNSKHATNDFTGDRYSVIYYNI
tara:strand:+ start:1533 stop:2060 length:528 start_codon:yes stop_codon:yes gene_type:complete